MNWEDLTIEALPTDDQKQRLVDFLAELRLLSAKYRIAVDTESELGPVVIDSDLGHVIGLGLTPQVRSATDPRIDVYDCLESVLDGVWLVDTEQGQVEQRTL